MKALATVLGNCSYLCSSDQAALPLEANLEDFRIEREVLYELLIRHERLKVIHHGRGGQVETVSIFLGLPERP